MALTTGLYGNLGMGDFSYDIVGENVIGAAKISLSDLLQAPDLALAQVVSNVRNNAWQYAIGATLFGISAQFTRKLLKKPINTVNRLVFTGKDAPLRGMGVRI